MTPRMKWVLLILLALLPSCTKQPDPQHPEKHISAQNVLDSVYAPTRREWLHLDISRSINFTLSHWDRRYGVAVAITDKDSTVYVTLTTANGEQPLSKEQQSYIIEYVTGIVESSLRQYPWAGHLKPRVQWVL